MNLLFFGQFTSAEEETLDEDQKQKVETTEERTMESEGKLMQAKKLGTFRVYPDIVTNLASESRNKLKYILLRIDVVVMDEKNIAYLDINQDLF